MNYGLFMMPSHPPERGMFEAHTWDLACLALADNLGFAEAWIGEHYTAPWEPIPSPDLMIAQALMLTKNIKLCSGVHLLPYHHPAELACRVAYLDHLAQGRFMFGIGAGGLPTDYSMFDVDGMNGQHREMTQESIDIILKLWDSEEPFAYQGKFWNASHPDPLLTLKHFIKPFQKPHPPIGVASVSVGSETLKIAGERGFIPMSLAFNEEYVKSHWDAVLEGALRTGKTPSRNEWRITRDVWVADSDDEAYDSALNGMLGRVWGEYLLPLFDNFGMTHVIKHDSNVPDSAVTPEYMANNVWLVGSPDTVKRKLFNLYEMCGGFGTLLSLVYDNIDNQVSWEKSMNLFAKEVMPEFSTLVPD
ncbi:MAG: LLM class flavin-dependent oxidoreductase [Chloroflexota bacterium]|nr:LLM class flavin-dependent oxidoreductase [Chloroflexota bacterium]